jgi:hypothetical protein
MTRTVGTGPLVRFFKIYVSFFTLLTTLLDYLQCIDLTTAPAPAETEKTAAETAETPAAAVSSKRSPRDVEKKKTSLGP